MFPRRRLSNSIKHIAMCESELINECKYFHGEEACPYEDGDRRALFWKIEKSINERASSSSLAEENPKDYLNRQVWSMLGKLCPYEFGELLLDYNWFTEDSPTKENTLYLPIKQIYFDQIVSGEKDREFREIKSGTTANKYLIASGNSSGYVLNPEHTCLGERYYVDDYNGGHFPFLPKKIKYLNLAVGYARERDTALVEVVGYSFDPQMIRCDSEGKPCFCFWMEAFHLGRVLQVHRKGELDG